MKILFYNIIDLSEGIHLAKSNNSKEYIVCLYWFFNHGFKYQDFVCNCCHDLLTLRVNISNIAIIAVKGVAYCCIIYRISKSDAIIY